MENRFPPHSTAWTQTQKGKWRRIKIIAEKFNGGRGHYYDVQYCDNGACVVRHTTNIFDKIPVNVPVNQG